MLKTKKINLGVLFVLSLSLTHHAYSQTAAPKSFEACAACHSFTPGEHLSGPSLNKLMGQRAGTKEGFRYSQAMKKSGIIWNTENLRQYIADPQGKIPGNRMPYSGLEDKEELNQLISYLEKMSANE
jgi:cytochrome c